MRTHAFDFVRARLTGEDEYFVEKSTHVDGLLTWPCRFQLFDCISAQFHELAIFTRRDYVPQIDQFVLLKVSEVVISAQCFKIVLEEQDEVLDTASVIRLRFQKSFAKVVCIEVVFLWKKGEQPGYRISENYYTITC